MLLLWSKEEILQELRGREMLASTHIYVFGNVLYDINHLHLVVELQSLLREISETHRIANIKFSIIRSNLSQQHFYKCRLTCTIVTNNSHLLESREVIVEIFEYNFLFKGLRYILALENLRTNIYISRF